LNMDSLNSLLDDLDNFNDLDNFEKPAKKNVDVGALNNLMKELNIDEDDDVPIPSNAQKKKPSNYNSVSNLDDLLDDLSTPIQKPDVKFAGQKQSDKNVSQKPQKSVSSLDDLLDDLSTPLHKNSPKAQVSVNAGFQFGGKNPTHDSVSNLDDLLDDLSTPIQKPDVKIAGQKQPEKK